MPVYTTTTVIDYRRASRLYEQVRERPKGPSRLGMYVRRWQWWSELRPPAPSDINDYGPSGRSVSMPITSLTYKGLSSENDAKVALATSARMTSRNSQSDLFELSTKTGQDQYWVECPKLGCHFNRSMQHTRSISLSAFQTPAVWMDRGFHLPSNSKPEEPPGS